MLFIACIWHSIWMASVSQSSFNQARALPAIAFGVGVSQSRPVTHISWMQIFPRTTNGARNPNGSNTVAMCRTTRRFVMLLSAGFENVKPNWSLSGRHCTPSVLVVGSSPDKSIDDCRSSCGTLRRTVGELLSFHPGGAPHKR